MPIMSVIRVLDPRALPDLGAGGASRLVSLQGARLGYLWNNRPRGDRVLRGLAQRLEEEQHTTTLFTNKLRVGMGATADEIRRLEKEVQAVIIGVGD
jgi:hypothetical protein